VPVLIDGEEQHEFPCFRDASADAGYHGVDVLIDGRRLHLGGTRGRGMRPGVCAEAAGAKPVTMPSATIAARSATRDRGARARAEETEEA